MTHRSAAATFEAKEREDLSAGEIADRVNDILSGDGNALKISNLMLGVEAAEIPLFDAQIQRYQDYNTFTSLTTQLSGALGAGHANVLALKDKLEEFYTLAPGARPSTPTVTEPQSRGAYK